MAGPKAEKRPAAEQSQARRDERQGRRTNRERRNKEIKKQAPEQQHGRVDKWNRKDDCGE